MYTGPILTSEGGSTYYAILPPEIHLINAYRYLLDARETALKNYPGGEGRARALVIDSVLKTAQANVTQAAIDSALEGERLIVERIDATQVRPDPGTKTGHRLRDVVKVTPIGSTVAGGGVGVGEVDELNKAVGEDGVPYWRAQEWGSSHLVGHKVRGAFDGHAKPDPAEFRHHAIFDTNAETKYEMLVENPIKPRHFLAEGTALTDQIRQRNLGDAVQFAMDELRLVQTGNHPRIRAARSFVRGRRVP